MNPVIRTALTHLGTGVGFAAAAVAYMASGKVDLYAIWDQGNKVVADVTTLIAMVTPVATILYGMWKARFQSKMADVEKDPRFKGAVVAPEVAVELGPKVQPSLPALVDAIHPGAALARP